MKLRDVLRFILVLLFMYRAEGLIRDYLDSYFTAETIRLCDHAGRSYMLVGVPFGVSWTCNND